MVGGADAWPKPSMKTEVENNCCSALAGVKALRTGNEYVCTNTYSGEIDGVFKPFVIGDWTRALCPEDTFGPYGNICVFKKCFAYSPGQGLRPRRSLN